MDENEEMILEVETTTKVNKPKWSLKKKLIVIGAGLVTLAIGAVALVYKNKPGVVADEVTEDCNDEEEEVINEETVEEIVETVTE